MTPKEIIAQLEDLKSDRESFVTELLRRDEPDNVFQKDIEALDAAIRIIKGLQEARTVKREKPLTQEECIRDLKASMDLWLFDPSTGETLTPDSLNDMNRMTYDAMEYAADFLQTHPRIGKHSYFYTFGTDPQFPFGINEYVEVHADDANQADQKFKSHFPCREGSTLLNCAFIYREEIWERVYREHYAGKNPARVID